MSLSRNVLVIGAHGKVALYMTPLLRNLGYSLTSMIRDESQSNDIKTAWESAAATEAKTDRVGKLSILVSNLEDVKSEEDAKKVIEEAGKLGNGKEIDTVVWSAGAGGKGPVERTYTVDRDIARYFVSASLSLPNVSTFLLVSALTVRRRSAPWWSTEGWEEVQTVNTKTLPDYFKAKLGVDEWLSVKARKRVAEGSFRYLILRPGWLAHGQGGGKVSVGKTVPTGFVERGLVAEVAAELLGQNEKEGRSGWYDMQRGEDTVEEAVAKVLKEGVDCMEGESVEEMERNITE